MNKKSILSFLKNFSLIILTKSTSQGIPFLFKERELPAYTTTPGTTRNKIISHCNIKLNKDTRALKNIIFVNCVFFRQKFEDITIKDCLFEECSFAFAEFKNVEIYNSEFVNSLFQKPKFEKTYLDPIKLKFKFSEWKREASNINTTLFQRLESNLRDLHQEDLAKGAHIKFRRYRRWQDVHEAKSANFFRALVLRRNYIISLLFDLILVYGYGLFRALILTVLFFIIAVFGIDLYWQEINLYSNSSGLEITQANSLQKLYFLVVTTTTLGYGDITPHSDFGMIVVVSLLAFSIVWTATLTALIVKRLVK